MIYFFQREDRAIKIGTTNDVQRRLAQLRKALGQPLRVLAVIDGSFPDEGRIHARFAHLRRDGEWFAAGPDLLAFIEAESQEWASDLAILRETLRSLVPEDRAVRIRVHGRKVAALVADVTGRPFSSVKLAKMLNSVKVSPATIGQLASGLDVDPAELLRA